MTSAGAEFDVLVVGELNADLILSGDVTPAFGQVERLVEDATLTIGSSSAIAACGMARLGLRVAFAGLVGDDEFGRFMRGALASRGVDITAVRVDPAVKTGLTVILSRGEDRAILTYPGSIAALRREHLDMGMLGRARHLHLGSYFLLDGLRPDVPALFAAARARGLTVSLDTNYDPAERWDGLDAVLPHVDILLPNEAELLAVSGAADVEAGLARLAGRVPLVAVKRGAAGALARSGAELLAAAAPPVAVVDPTGAGDSFDAGLLYGLLAGWELARSLRLACVCGALSTRAAGGTAAQPTLAEALGRL
jgi:sugar/nucleoside kinase (ribokinase family)